MNQTQLWNHGECEAAYSYFAKIMVTRGFEVTTKILKHALLLLYPFSTRKLNDLLLTRVLFCYQKSSLKLNSPARYLKGTK